MTSQETWIGLRYLRAKKRSGFMSFISIISIVGIAIGVIALIVVLSVMNGFHTEIRGQLLKVAPHMEMGFIKPNPDDNWHILAKVAQRHHGILGTSPYVANQALLANDGEVRGVQIKGIDPQTFSQVSEFKDKFPPSLYQKLIPGQFDVLLGQELANALSVQAGDKVTMIIPDGNITPVGVVPRMKQFNVIGIINSGIFAVDNTLAITHIKDAQKIYHLRDADVGLQIRLKKPESAPEITATLLSPQEQHQFWVRDWTFQNKDYFQAIEVEKKMMFVIMFFISLVASINLISTLIMTVTEKQSDIAILRTLGMSPRSIMKIFMVQGVMLGLIGTLSGVIIGTGLALEIGNIVHIIEDLLGKKFIASSVYFIDYIPSKVLPSDILIIASISMLLSFLVTLYPSWRAAKTQPAEALRYE